MNVEAACFLKVSTPFWLQQVSTGHLSINRKFCAAPSNIAPPQVVPAMYLSRFLLPGFVLSMVLLFVCAVILSDDVLDNPVHSHIAVRSVGALHSERDQGLPLHPKHHVPVSGKHHRSRASKISVSPSVLPPAATVAMLAGHFVERPLPALSQIYFYLFYEEITPPPKGC